MWAAPPGYFNGSSGFRVGKKPAPWGMVDRSPLPCDANCLNAQKNGSARAAASRAAADLVAEPPQLLPTRDPEEPQIQSLPTRCSRLLGCLDRCGSRLLPGWRHRDPVPSVLAPTSRAAHMDMWPPPGQSPSLLFKRHQEAADGQEYLEDPLPRSRPLP